MNIRLWLAGFVIVSLGFPANRCLSDDVTGKPALGQPVLVGSLLFTVEEEEIVINPAEPPHLGAAVPIGRLILVGATGEQVSGTVFNAIIADQAPRLGPPIMLASLLPDEFEPSRPAVIDPSDIQEHLVRAAQLLNLSGLAEESAELQKLIEKFQTVHHDRLLLKLKEAELAALQTEVEQLRASVGLAKYAPSVHISVKIIEWSYESSTPVFSPKQTTWDQVDELVKAGKAKIVSEPSLVVAHGMTGRFHSGGELDPQLVKNAGHFGERDFGTSLEATPEILDGNRVRLKLDTQLKQLDHEHSINGVPGVNHRRASSTQELPTGEMRILGHMHTTAQRDPKASVIVNECVIAVKAEIVPPPLVPVLK
jgi:hypothetical protein